MLEPYRRLFSGLGYRERFTDRGVRNLEIKRPFVKELMPTINISFFDAPEAMSVEVIEQGRSEDVFSLIFPITDNVLLTDIETRSDRIPNLRRDGSPTRSFVIKVANIAASTRLWVDGLGCKHVARDVGRCELQFRSPFQNHAFHFYLVEDPFLPQHFSLDAYGFMYFALVCTSPRRDRERLRELGFEVTDIERSEVHGKQLSFFFVTGPFVSPVEIIGIEA